MKNRLKKEGASQLLTNCKQLKLLSADGKRYNTDVANTEQLEYLSAVAKNATTVADGKTYQVDYYSLDVIISVGYRVNSKILFTVPGKAPAQPWTPAIFVSESYQEICETGLSPLDVIRLDFYQPFGCQPIG